LRTRSGGSPETTRSFPHHCSTLTTLLSRVSGSRGATVVHQTRRKRTVHGSPLAEMVTLDVSALSPPALSLSVGRLAPPLQLGARRQRLVLRGWRGSGGGRRGGRRGARRLAPLAQGRPGRRFGAPARFRGGGGRHRGDRRRTRYSGCRREGIGRGASRRGCQGARRRRRGSRRGP
jgi:hypothetical protein